MIKEGDIAVIKTSGELVYVQRMGTVDPDVLLAQGLYHAADWGTVRGNVQVRRPVLTKTDGIKHVDEVFKISELETVEEHFRREAVETKRKREIAEEVFQPVRPSMKGDVSVN